MVARARGAGECGTSGGVFSRERGKRVRDLKGQWNCSKEKGWYEYDRLRNTRRF